MSGENNFTAEIQKLGRITVPYEAGQFLGIKEGDLVVIEIKGIKHQGRQEEMGVQCSNRHYKPIGEDIQENMGIMACGLIPGNEGRDIPESGPH